MRKKVCSKCGKNYFAGHSNEVIGLCYTCRDNKEESIRITLDELNKIKIKKTMGRPKKKKV